jgi:hypothetical protein
MNEKQILKQIQKFNNEEFLIFLEMLQDYFNQPQKSKAKWTNPQFAKIVKTMVLNIDNFYSDLLGGYFVD